MSTKDNVTDICHFARCLGEEDRSTYATRTTGEVGDILCAFLRYQADGLVRGGEAFMQCLAYGHASYRDARGDCAAIREH